MSCHPCKICKGLTVRYKLFTVHNGKGIKKEILQRNAFDELATHCFY